MVRINVKISEDLNKKIDILSERWGVTKSMLCAMGIGQFIDNLESSSPINQEQFKELNKKE